MKALEIRCNFIIALADTTVLHLFGQAYDPSSLLCPVRVHR